jgi:cobaltochelatase CobN
MLDVGRGILFLTAADTELLGWSLACRRLPADFPPVRARHLRRLEDPSARELLLREAVPEAGVVIARVLGGRGYFAEGIDLLARACRGGGVPFLALPGGRELDPELASASTVPDGDLLCALRYFVHGGVSNYEHLLRFLADRFLGTAYGYASPTPTPEHGVYEVPGLPPLPDDSPRVGILFYRAHWLSGNLLPIDALASALAQEGCRPRAVYCDSLKDLGEDGLPRAVGDHLRDAEVLVCTLAFSAPHGLDCPVIQAVMSSGSTRREWEESSVGLGPRDVAMHVALPEFDGRLIAVPIAFKEEGAWDALLGEEVRRSLPVADRVRQVARLARAWCTLRRTPNREKRVAILFNNYPTRNARVGNGVGLDTPASVVRLLRALKDAGYRVDPVPASGESLIQELLAGCTQDEEFHTPARLLQVPHVVEEPRYRERFLRLPAPRREEMLRQWGEPPGGVMATPRGLAVPGLLLGNVFVGIQPARGYGQDPRSIYHSPDLPPTHSYVAYYQWILEVFGAHAVVHMGKHGNLEWLPGKGIGLSASCYPEVVLEALPNIYPYIINNPGEGTQAKRRAHAVIVDHLIPPMTRAESYGDLLRLEQLADEYAQVSVLDPGKRGLVAEQILSLLERSRLYRDLDYDRPPAAEELDDFLASFDGYLCEIKESQIRDGLHILGELPEGDRLVDLLVALVRQDQAGVRGLPAAIAEDLGVDYDRAVGDPAAPAGFPGCRTAGDLLELLEQRAREVVRTRRPVGPRSAETLRFLLEEVWPRLLRTPDEIAHILRALDGRFVPPGPSGAPTRGMATILPTGRNFYSVDVRGIPTPTAAAVGRQAAEALLRRYLAETGTYPRCIGMIVWGTSTMRTGGDDIGEILHLLGVRPLWADVNRRVTGIEVIPLDVLGRPRVDVVVRISGFFRDAFPNLVELLDDAVRTVAALPEPPERNYVRAHLLADPDDPGYRVFGSKPGSYGAGLLPLLDARAWETDRDLLDVYVAWGGYAYGKGAPGIEATDLFRRRLRGIVLAVQNQDNREHDIFDSDDYFQFHGGMIAAVRALAGSSPRAYLGDTSRPDRVRIRDLREEVVRVFRSRVVNPKWIRGVLRHGYRGAAEMAATVDYLFGYDATAHVVEPWMYEEVAARYLLDDEVRRVLEQSNPWALRAMVERLLEAASRGLWTDPPPDLLERLREIYLRSEADVEVRE